MNCYLHGVHAGEKDYKLIVQWQRLVSSQWIGELLEEEASHVSP